MKKSGLQSVIIILMMITLFLPMAANAQNTSSQAQSFKYYITNEAKTADNILEFDLFLLNTNPGSTFELASVQSGIFVNPEFCNGGKVTASIVEGSSELIDPQKPVGIIYAQAQNIIKIAAKMIKLDENGKMITSHGTNISAVSPGTRVCRVRLSNSAPFANAPANLTFCFERNPYPTMVAEYISGINTPLTCNSANCYNKAASTLKK
jgi:hypothetical protein